MQAMRTRLTGFYNHPGSTMSYYLRRWLPFTGWLLNYRRRDLAGDLMAGVIVTIMLVPQSMAYAMLAGLPPQVGLYASIVPLVIYGLLGTSRALAVGPVAIVSLLVAAGVGQFAPQSSAEYIALALTLALLVGVIQLGMGLLRVGFLVNFLSHPVLSGFTSAAALVIGFSQLRHVLGIDIPRSDQLHETLRYAVEHFSGANPVTLGIAVLSLILLVYFKTGLAAHLRRAGLPAALVMTISKGGPLVVVLLSTLATGLLRLDERAGVAIVGAVPAGLPPLGIPVIDLERIAMLLPIALTISLIGFMESISVAKSLASKRRQKIDANQELVALGAANVGAAFTGGYPVTGGISRSLVNFSAGANTGLASILTAGMIALTVLLLTPLFYYLPGVVLAVIIIVAVANLIDVSAFVHAWRYNRSDAASLLATFLAVLALGIETGILVGVAASLGLYLWRTSQPHIAIVGRVEDSEHFRNVLRHRVRTHPKILVLRVDESLYFPNAQYLENFLLNAVADRPEVDHVVLVCSAINYIDSSALETLESLMRELAEAGVRLHLAEIKGPVMDRLIKIGFVSKIGRDRVYLSTHEAVQHLAARYETDEAPAVEELVRQ
jgi:sulfate permease, SulP family